MDICGKDIPGGGKSEFKDPEVGTRLECLRNSTVQGDWRSVKGGWRGEWEGTRLCGPWEALWFYSERNEEPF